MKKLLITLGLGICLFSANAQVGIGTNTPSTDLDVEARTIPAASTTDFNGVLIPRVTAIPTVVAPAGTLIYVTGGATPGFYFSNGAAYINVTDTLTATGPFFESGTTDVASDNTQNIFRTGQTSFGEDLAGPQLYVGSTAIVGSPRTTVGIRNLNTSTANANTFSIDLNNLSSTTATKYGIRNNVSTAGVGEHIGIENTVFDSGFASTSVTGLLNDVGATTGTSSENYGIRTEIGSASSRGTNYAIYAYSQHGTTTSDPSYSGYFRGDRFAIRSEDDSDGYEMPTVDGTANQVLTTDGSGNASWSDNVSASEIFFDSGTTTAATSTTTDIFRQGITNIGDDFGSAQMNVGSRASATSPNTAMYVRNFKPFGTTSNTYALDVYNASNTTGTKVGIRSDLNSSGTGIHIGIDNRVIDGPGAATNYGIRSEIPGTGDETGTSYGLYSKIGSSTSRGTNYAVYAFSEHGTTTTDPSYSGYFRGDRFAIRSEDDSDGYEMPTVGGTAGQVLTTDGSVASWQNNTLVKSIVTLNLWGNEANLYGINNTGSFTDRNGIEAIFDISSISTTGNLEIRLVIDQTNNSNGTTDYQLRAIDNSGTSSTAISAVDTFYTANGAGGGYINTTSWVTYSAGSGGIARFILQANNSGSNNADIRSVYLMIRNAD